MKFKFQLIILLFTAILSCDEAEDISESELVVESPPEEELVEEDATKPVITIIGLTDIIEKKTDISIQIEDESTVETKVLRDGEELISSSEKQFDLTVNPYPIPVGATDFIVVSKDALGNETTETYTVEIKHLLIENFYIELITDVVDVSFKNLIFFNNLDGKELAVFEPMGPNEKVYTDETIMEDYILFTSVNHTVFPQSTSGGRNQSLWLRTHKIPLGMKRREGIKNDYVEPQNTVEVTLNGIPLVNGSPDFYAYGEGYKTVAHSGNDTQTNLTINHDGIQPIYIRTNRWGGSTPKFDGKKENYRYVVVKPETGNTSIQIESDKLTQAERSIKLDIPEQDPGTLFFHRNAFASTESLVNEGASIYEKDSAGETSVVDYLDLPVFSNFNFYLNYLSYGKNGFHYSTRGNDAKLSVNMPDWSANTYLAEDTIEVIATNPDVDYYSVGLYKKVFDNGIGLNMRWTFYLDGDSNNEKKAPLFDLPDMIKEAVNEPYLQTPEGMEITSLAAVDYTNLNSYDQNVDKSVFNNSDFVGAGNLFRQVNFPISNTSDKSKTMKGPGNSNMFHHDIFDIDINEPRPRIY